MSISRYPKRVVLIENLASYDNDELPEFYGYYPGDEPRCGDDRRQYATYKLIKILTKPKPAKVVNQK